MNKHTPPTHGPLIWAAGGLSLGMVATSAIPLGGGCVANARGLPCGKSQQRPGPG